jgi:hypothetical protein
MLNGNKPMPPPPTAPKAALSFTEQLALQSQNLKKVQTENQINNVVNNMSQSQKIKLTNNLHAVLEQRKKALMNDNKEEGGGESEEGSGNENQDSDDSAW